MLLSSYYRGVPLQELQHSNVVSGPTLAFFWLLGIGAISAFVICTVTWWNSLASSRFRGM